MNRPRKLDSYQIDFSKRNLPDPAKVNVYTEQGDVHVNGRDKTGPLSDVLEVAIGLGIVALAASALTGVASVAVTVFGLAYTVTSLANAFDKTAGLLPKSLQGSRFTDIDKWIYVGVVAGAIVSAIYGSYGIAATCAITALRFDDVKVLTNKDMSLLDKAQYFLETTSVANLLVIVIAILFSRRYASRAVTTVTNALPNRRKYRPLGRL